MKLETKAALYTALTLIALIVGSLTSAFYRAETARAAVQATPAVLMTPAERQMIIPIAGLAPAKLIDTWGAARSEGRRHEGIDIMAARGEPVHAVAGGTIAKLFTSTRGGITVYQFDASKRFILYYAHLDHYADGLKQGDAVKQGQVIGYVGRTGNATTPHLHFEIQRIGPDHNWWQGVSFNPYLALSTGQME